MQTKCRNRATQKDCLCAEGPASMELPEPTNLPEPGRAGPHKSAVRATSILRGLLELIDSGAMKATSAQRAYLAGAADTCAWSVNPNRSRDNVHRYQALGRPM